MMFVAMAFVGVVLIGAPLCGLFYLALCLLFRYLHRRYLAKSEGGEMRKWRKVLSIICGVLAGLNLAAGAAGWIFFLIANT